MICPINTLATMLLKPEQSSSYRLLLGNRTTSNAAGLSYGKYARESGYLEEATYFYKFLQSFAYSKYSAVTHS